MKPRYRLKISLFLTGVGFLSLFSWLFYTATSPLLPSPENPILFYSNQRQQDLKLTLCRALEQAQKSIYLQIYSLTDAKIISLLNQKREEGIFTAILYDKKASGNLKKKIKTADPAHTQGLMHRKILVLDEIQTFLGSANFTPQSLQMHDNLILGIYHPGLAHFLNHSKEEYFGFQMAEQRAELWMLPSKNALHRLIQLIDNAKKSLYVAMFTFTHPRLVEALIEAKKRGVDVRLAIDYHTSQGASAKALSRLEIEKIAIYPSGGQQLLHHKWALIDQQTLIIGSANWTKAALEKNQDCFLILDSLSCFQQNFLNKLWKIIQLESDSCYKEEDAKMAMGTASMRCLR